MMSEADKLDEVWLAILSATFGGLAASLLTLAMTRWSTLKTIKSAQEGLRTQLLYDEKKKALRQLRELVDQKYKTYPEFKTAIFSFLDSFEADFLPPELKVSIRLKINELDKFLIDSGLAPPPPPEEDYYSWREAYEEDLKSLPYYEKAELEFDERFGTIKTEVKDLISEHTRP
jgi:hypothetical protein